MAGQGTESDTKALLKEREVTYGRAWLLAGLVMSHLQQDNVDFGDLIHSGMLHNWMQILSKLMRLIISPGHKDSWRDIAGYAMLVVEYLEGNEK